MQLRRATPRDAEAACAVLRRSIAELCQPDHQGEQTAIACWLSNKTPHNVRAWISNPDNIFMVAVDGETILGVAAMTRRGCVTLNYVRPECRFQGVSKALLAALEKEASRLELPHMTLTSTQTAAPFYRAAGYVDDATAPRSDALHMTKALGARAGPNRRGLSRSIQTS